MDNVRSGTDRRGDERGDGRRANVDTLALSMRHLVNAERIVALLTFVPFVTTEREAAEREAAADALAEENTLLLSLILS